MMYKVSQRQRFVACAISGLVFVLHAFVVYSRLMFYDPFARSVPSAFSSPRSCADVVAVLYYLLTGVGLGKVVVVLRGAGFLGLGLSILFWSALFLIGAAATGAWDLVFYYLINYGWVATVIGALALLWLTRRRELAAGSLWPWKRLWLVGAASFVSGMAVYFLVNVYGMVLMTLKVISILIVPTVCLLATTVAYRGRFAAAVRLATLTIALLPTAVVAF